MDLPSDCSYAELADQVELPSRHNQRRTFQVQSMPFPLAKMGSVRFPLYTLLFLFTELPTMCAGNVHTRLRDKQ